LSFRIVRGQIHEHADAPHPLGLLRVRRERPQGCGAAQTADEISTREQTAQHVFSTLPVSIIKHSITKAGARPWIILKCSESIGSAKTVCRRDGRDQEGCGWPYRFGEVRVATLALLIFTAL
jgi:hypothetical protein